MLDPAVEAFAGLLFQVANVIGCHNRLDVRGQPASPRMEIQALIDKVDLGALVNKFAQVGPVFQVPCAPVHPMVTLEVPLRSRS